MTPLFLIWHLGLGDAIISNGLVRYLAKRVDNLILPVKLHNIASVRWMFSDLDNIDIFPVTGDMDMVRTAARYRSIGLGIWSRHGLRGRAWDEQFYADAQIPYECRWTEFKLPIDPNPPQADHDFIFLHEDRLRGDYINPALLPPKIWAYRPSRNLPFKDHIVRLQTAAEIHVIDSCFCCLTECIPVAARRLVLHRYSTNHDNSKNLGPPLLRKRWLIHP